jgi:hypothetical protein
MLEFTVSSAFGLNYNLDLLLRVSASPLVGS